MRTGNPVVFEGRKEGKQKRGGRSKCVMTSNLADANLKVLDAKPMPNSATNSANDKINEKSGMFRKIP